MRISAASDVSAFTANLKNETTGKRRNMPANAEKPKGFSRRKIIAAAAILLLVAAMGLGYYKFRYHFIPQHFFVVEEGAIFRGARQQPRVLHKIIQKHQIQTVISLDDKLAREGLLKGRDPAPYHAARAIVKEAGAKYFGFNWKGAGIGPLEEYEQVADLLANAEHQPIYFHCHHGRMRTSAALAAYWIRHRGHSTKQAIDRLVREYNFIPDEEPEFISNMQRFEERQLGEKTTN